MSKIFIIDASGYLYRSYHAIRNMTNAKGESTNSLFGFIRSVLNIIADFKPEYMVAVFDGPNNIKKRKEIYADYKAHRVETPGDLYYQIEWAREFCDLMGIPSLFIPEVEADDAMASVVKLWETQGAEAYMCTSDKDMAQMVNHQVFMLDTYKDNKVMGVNEVKEKFGVLPEQIIDMLAMVGDASDNVPGLPGIGPKTAATLLLEHGTLEKLLDNPQLVQGKKQEVFHQFAAQARLSKKLVTVDSAIEIPRPIEFYKIKEAKISALKDFYTAKSFNSLIKELDKVEQPREVEKSVDIKLEEIHYHLVDNASDFSQLMASLLNYSQVCFNIVISGERALSTELVGVSFSVEPEEAWYVPLNGNLDKKIGLEGLKNLFGNQKVSFCGHNVKQAMHVFENYGIVIAHVSFDIVLASYVLNAQSRNHSLENLILELFGKVKMPLSDLLGKGKSSIPLQNLPPKILSGYSCEDADYICRLQKRLKPQIEERDKLHSLYYTVELPLTHVLQKMERRGIFLDVPYLKSISKFVMQQINSLENEIGELAGEKLNLNSPKQLGELLTKMGLRLPKNKSGGYSTGADVLEGLKEFHPIIGKIQEYRIVEKLRSTYIDTLPLEIFQPTSRIHCTFNQVMAATGRLSCQDPNLQNIPIRTEVGRKIREAFKPQREGWSFLAADYSQIELRLLAHISEDPALVSAFMNNEDIHVQTAAKIYNIPVEEVTKDQRQSAKAVNFGIVYGQQAFGLSQELGIEVKDASRFIEAYFKSYPYVLNYLESSKEFSKKTGKTFTLMGRERNIPEIHSKNGMIRAAAERLAINTPLQGTAADLIKMAMLSIDQELSKRHMQGYMILQVHDELIFELPDAEVEEMKEIVRHTMENVVKLKIPLVVDINIGKNWKEC